MIDGCQKNSRPFGGFGPTSRAACAVAGYGEPAAMSCYLPLAGLVLGLVAGLVSALGAGFEVLVLVAIRATPVKGCAGSRNAFGMALC